MQRLKIHKMNLRRMMMAVLMLTMVSMGAEAKIDVQIANDGKFTGGTIKEKSQTEPDEKGLVTVTITVTHDKCYTIKNNDITVVSTYSPSASTRAPEIAAPLTLLGKDPENLGDPRDYTFIVASTLGAWVKEATFIKKDDDSKGNRDIVYTTISDLAGLKSMTTDGNYMVTADINAAGAEGYTTSLASFIGHLTAQAKADGTFPIITGLTVPLFTTATDATISNIMFKNIAVSGSGPIGAICGTANGTTRIYNCGVLPTTLDHPKGTTRSTVTSTDNDCGSLVGYLDGYARVINCFSYANVSASSNAGGLVGNNTTATMQGNNQTNFDNNVKTMVVNCMFYGEITAGATKCPVYGGTAIVNNAADKVNNYNYYCEDEASFDNDYTAITDYNYSWPVAKKYLVRFEVYRNILNSNRRLCTWWVSGSYNTAPTDADVENVGIAKWVLDQSIAPYPILKKWGKYYSTFDIDPNYVWNPKTKAKVARTSAKAWEGKSYGTISVTINGGSNNSSASTSRNITITDMDSLGYDYCARKIQLPYYNEIFGDPDGATWAAKYGNNYTTKVVTGWKVTKVNGSTTGTGPDFSEDWESGYNFADRTSTKKDLYSVSKRVFAQGGYYYVPDNVNSIEIEAYWGDAVYLCNSNRCLDKMNNGTSEFYVSGQLPEKVGGIDTNPTVQTSLQNAVGALKTINNAQSPGETVYDQAIVLVGNYQDYSCHTYLTLSGNDYNTKAKPFTIMSADFDFDNEPDFCFQAGMNGGNRPNFQPIRFDFLMVPDITMAIRTVDLKYYGIRNICPQGHYEVTETSYMYVTQFEYDRRTNSNIYNKHEAPMILNGGEFTQIISTHTFTQADANATATARADRTSYFLMGGKLYMKAFTPGTHVNTRSATRHCTVNAIGGEFPEFYLSGMFRSDFYNMTDNPHAYLDGGWFGTVAGAGMESVGAKDETDGGNVTFKINHSRIHELYGGGINANRPVTGNIEVTIDNSIVHKYCGGPKLGDMSSSKSITTTATGTTFDQFFGGGNGGTNMLRENKFDGWQVTAPTKTDHSVWDDNTTGSNKKGGKFNAFTPFKYETGKGYQAEFEFELLPIPAGDNTTVPRTYYHYASFSKTTVAPVTNTITDCTFRGNFYGGGNLGAVGSPAGTTDPAVSSTLKGNTVAHGSVFGAGYSAAATSFKVHDKSTVDYPYRDFAGFIHDGSLDYNPIEYTWIHDIPAEWGITPTPSTTNPTFEYPVGSGKWYCYSPTSMDGLGTVTGDVTLNLEGNTIVMGKIVNMTKDEDGNNIFSYGAQTGGVFGGGDASGVVGKTKVTINTSGQQNGYDYNVWNVFGGGNEAKVDGDTSVTLLGNTVVQKDVFGGGNEGEVSGTSKVNIMYNEE